MRRLAKPLKGSVYRLQRAAEDAARQASTRNMTLAPWFYAAGSDRFRREQHAVLAGMARFATESRSDAGNLAFLRRSIHTIEKGLLMRPRRDVFALGYIAETIEAYENRLAEHDSVAAPVLDLQWAHDVLDAYFRATAAHPVIDPLRARFAALPRPSACGNEPLVPYRRASGPPPVDYDALLALARRRRSVRWFLPEPVPRELIEKAVAVASQSPTACNRQPFVFRVFDEPALAKKVADIPMGAAGYGEQIPAVAVIVGQQRNFFDERDRHLIYIDGSLAAMSFALALETLGLSSCLINWPDIEEREAAMAACIGLEADERPVMLVGIGYPDPEGLVAASAKKPPSELIRYNLE